MPIKWTPETDQILLLKILETSEVSPKCPEIAAKWPAGLDRPTPRAISERIHKIRATAKASGASGHFSISSAKSNPGTPRKSAANGIGKKATPKKTTNGAKAGAGKRKRGGRMSEEDSDDTEADGFNSENDGSEPNGEDGTRQKKPKINTAAKGRKKSKDMVKMETGEGENGAFDNDNDRENLYDGAGGGVEVIDYA